MASDGGIARCISWITRYGLMGVSPDVSTGVHSAIHASRCSASSAATLLSRAALVPRASATASANCASVSLASPRIGYAAG